MGSSDNPGRRVDEVDGFDDDGGGGWERTAFEEEVAAGLGATSAPRDMETEK